MAAGYKREGSGDKKEMYKKYKEYKKEDIHMAKRIAKFEKVSFEQFKGGYTDAIGEASDEQIREVYDSLKLPKRATKDPQDMIFMRRQPSL